MNRKSIDRARLFLRLADECSADSREECEAFMEAAIIFTRSAVHRLQAEHQKHRKWKPWWNGLLMNESVTFIRDERDHIVKEGPPIINQVIRVGHTEARARDCYYYGLDPDVPATVNLASHIDAIEKVVAEGERLFAESQAPNS